MNYYELAPEDNSFIEVVADVTHRCNMSCKNCYIPNREIPDMDTEKLIECVSKFPKRVMVRIIGAEPTMRKDLPDIITRVKKAGHKVCLLTNGLRLSKPSYCKRLKDAGLRHVYISMNGVDNDDWYELIDELRCAKKKVSALKNAQRNNFVIDIGCILVKGINDTAPTEMIRLLKQVNVKNCVIRFKNVGQIGRHMSVRNHTLNSLKELVANQFNISVEHIDKHSINIEKQSILFPINPKAKLVYKSGIWIKLTNWDSSGEYSPLLNSKRRGRITQNFKVAPFFEHVKQNEFQY
tara:strand:+ start:26 stop:907 length:882 start_codon:yes stop_codon:yes gene_type:complete